MFSEAFYISFGKSSFDELVMPNLTICSVVLEGGIFASHLIWMFRTRKIRNMAKKDGKTFDDIAREYEVEGVEFKLGERQQSRAKVDHSAQLPFTESDVTPAQKGVSWCLILSTIL